MIPRPLLLYRGSIFLLFLLLQPVEGAAGTLSPLSALLGKTDALVVTDQNDRTLFVKNGDRLMVPASTLKVLTALAAIHHLKPDYRFETRFYLDRMQNLTMKGFGDPLLISEVLDRIAVVLKDKVKIIRNIYLDDSYFNAPLTIPGVSASAQPYDAPNGALCANFNTVSFQQENGRFVSGEPQTPLLPFVLTKITKSGLSKGRITFSHGNGDTLRYAGLLMRHFLEKHGVTPTGSVMPTLGAASGASLLYSHRSEFTLLETIEKLLEFSNNFMANQLLITAGAKAFGPPGNLEKGVRAAEAYVHDLLGISQVVIAEGSGISRKNRISARAMITILAAFEPYRHLMRKDGPEIYKTGRLKGIATRAGYVESKSGNLYRYALFLNTPGKRTEPVMKKLIESLP